MTRYILPLLLCFSFKAQAEGADVLVDYTSMDVFKVHTLFVSKNTMSADSLPNLVERENRIESCVIEYIDEESNTYAKIVKNNLYDLIHNFDRVLSKLYRKDIPEDNVTYQDKIRLLARVQCETYVDMGVLK